MQQGPTSPFIRKKQTSGDIFCGADRGIYKWSQTISDLDVVVPVPSEISTSKLVKVDATQDNLKVSICKENGKWFDIIDDNLCFRVKPGELMWSLESSKSISISLEKVQERWWESLLSNEPKINLQDYELSRPLHELSEEEEMTLHKIWSNQIDKRRAGLENS